MPSNDLENDSLHVFDVTRREGVLGHIRIVAGDSKADAQSKLADQSLTSEFERHATKVSEGRYVGGDIEEHSHLRTLDGESDYDGVDYLGTLSKSFEEIVSRLSTGSAQSVLMTPTDVLESLDETTVEALQQAESEGRQKPIEKRELQ